MEPSGCAPAHETAAVVALLRAGARSSGAYADAIEERRSALDLVAEEQGLLTSQLLKEAAADVARWSEQGISTMTLLDADYPENLRAVYDRPPLLFIAGQLEPCDSRSVAVIGSRRASAAGLARTRAVAERLVDAGYSIASGLAAGVDTAAHQAALDSGGRTIAVIGTGLHHAYPPQNLALQRRIADEGAVISQFWPASGPARENFPLRNAVMSGLALATIIVEATLTSGARTQARAAVAHGRPVLLASVLLEQPWAQQLSARPGVHVMHSLRELNDLLARLCSTDELVA